MGAINDYERRQLETARGNTEERVKATAGTKINQGLGDLIKKKEQPEDEGADIGPAPKASDFGGNLGQYSSAMREYNAKKASRNPQAAAVKGMLEKKSNAGMAK